MIALDSLRPFRMFGLASLFALSGTLGCTAVTDAGETVGTSEGSIVDVEHTAVERQLIGNCWLYSHATWAESMHKTRTGVDVDVSQSYWTYWHWFDQITGRNSWAPLDVSVTEISTGGTYATANGIVRRYGMMTEATFLPDDGDAEGSTRQSKAEARMKRELAPGGLLGTASARADAAKVRLALDVAWGLKTEVLVDGVVTGYEAAGPWSATLDAVFGTAAQKTFDGTVLRGTLAQASGGVIPASQFAVAYPVRSRTGVVTMKNTTLATAIGEWRQVYYSRGQRSFHQSVQRALHERAPVILTWNVDFNALSPKFLDAANLEPNPESGQFRLDVLQANGPGRQGGHMVVLEDYEATLATGEVLKAGVTLPANDPRLKVAANDSGTKIAFYRVKNSWGTTSSRGFVPGFNGYHDLHMSYLDGPIEWCRESENAVPYAERGCVQGNTPLRNVVLPPGF